MKFNSMNTILTILPQVLRSAAIFIPFFSLGHLKNEHSIIIGRQPNKTDCCYVADQEEGVAQCACALELETVSQP